ncbi:hypothetical protein AAKU64_000909 [Undibacterium sp. GrIS 1.8]
MSAVAVLIIQAWRNSKISSQRSSDWLKYSALGMPRLYFALPVAGQFDGADVTILRKIIVDKLGDQFIV